MCACQAVQPDRSCSAWQEITTLRKAMESAQQVQCLMWVERTLVRGLARETLIHPPHWGQYKYICTYMYKFLLRWITGWHFKSLRVGNCFFTRRFSEWKGEGYLYKSGGKWKAKEWHPVGMTQCDNALWANWSLIPEFSTHEVNYKNQCSNVFNFLALSFHFIVARVCKSAFVTLDGTQKLVHQLWRWRCFDNQSSPIQVADDLTSLIDTANAPIFVIDTQGRANVSDAFCRRCQTWKNHETYETD